MSEYSFTKDSERGVFFEWKWESIAQAQTILNESSDRLEDNIYKLRGNITSHEV